MSLHIIRTEDMDRIFFEAHGLTPRDPVQTTIVNERHTSPAAIAGLCDVVVMDQRGTYTEAASVRALRAEPGRFEAMPELCVDCVRVFATLDLTTEVPR